MANANSIELRPSLSFASHSPATSFFSQHEKKSCCLGELSIPELNFYVLGMISKTFYFDHLYPSHNHATLKLFGHCKVIGAIIEESDIPAICIEFSDGTNEYYSIAELSISESNVT